MPVLQLLRRFPLVAFFTLAYAISWALVLPMTLSQNLGLGLLPYVLPDALGLALYLLASVVGPNLAALIVTAFTEGRVGVRALLRRIVQWRVAPQWYLAALFANFTVWLAAYSLVVGLALPAAVLSNWPQLFTTFLPAVALGLLIPSIGEEPGWRGFALPRLQERYGPLRATLILGLLHGLWHLPALGTIMLGPKALAELPPFLLTVVGGTFLYTWIFNRTCGSVLLAMLAHASSNAASQYLNKLFVQDVPLPQEGVVGWMVNDGWLNVIAYGIVALLLLAFTRGRLGSEAEPAPR